MVLARKIDLYIMCIFIRLFIIFTTKFNQNATSTCFLCKPNDWLENAVNIKSVIAPKVYDILNKTIKNNIQEYVVKYKNELKIILPPLFLNIARSTDKYS